MLRFLTGMILLSASLAVAQGGVNPAIAGRWDGTLHPTPTVALRLEMQITRAADGHLSATFTSLDQGNAAFPASEVTLADRTLIVTAGGVHASFSGSLSPDGQTFTGNWTQGGATWPMSFERQQQPAAAATAGTAAGPVEGWWEGGLPVSGLTLRLEMHVFRGADGGLAATFKSLDQGGAEFPASRVTQAGTSLTVAAAAAHAGFNGTLSPDGQTLAGDWSQGGGTLPITFHRASGPLIEHHAQEPKPPFPYAAVDVTVSSVGGIKLAGTLTTPPGVGPFPAAILIAGSGPGDRDENLVGHKFFLVLADALTRRGIAVLRMDKRGIGQSGGDANAATTMDLAQDVEADLDFLERAPHINPRAIGLIGHSEGGLIAPMVASRRPAVAFVVLMAGPGERGDKLLVAQGTALLTAEGAPPAAQAQNAAMQRKLFGIVETTTDPAQLRAKLAATVPGGQLPAGQMAMLTSPWMRTFLTLDPTPYLEKLRCPVLALIGSKDLQVPATVNLPLLRQALAGDSRATVAEMPGLNHMFQTAKTGLPSEYATIDETMAPAALARIGVWIAAQTAAGR